MELLKNAWNYQPSPEVKGAIKTRAIKGIVWLLSLMLCFTLISRATSSMTVPIVDTEKPGNSTILHTITVDGVLETDRDTGVTSTSGALVNEVFVKEGDKVAAGDPLFTYDTKDFNQQISQKQVQINRLQTELRGIQERAALNETNKETSLERAEEDYDTALSQADLDVRAAGEAVRFARDNLDKYQGVRRSEYDEYEEGEYTREEYDAFHHAHREALINEEKAIAARDKVIQDAKRLIVDAEKPTVDVSADTAKLDIQALQLEMGILYEAVANKGQVFAPVDGVITKIQVGAGTRTTNEAAMYLNNSENMNFVTEVSKEEKKHVNIGNTVKLRMAGETKDIQGLTITSVAPSTTTLGAYRVTIEMPADYLPGTSGTVEIQQKSKSYETCVPLSSLYADGAQYYVLAVLETETSMGTECFAERIDVTLQEKNETYAAVTGALNSDTKVISEASKSIKDGDRVRLKDKV